MLSCIKTCEQNEHKNATSPNLNQIVSLLLFKCRKNKSTKERGHLSDCSVLVE